MATYATNKNYTRLYHEIKRYTAGLELLGIEVKAIKAGKAQIHNGYITITNNEVFLRKTHIAPYQMNNTPSHYDPERVRRLLLTKREIRDLIHPSSQQGLTIVPIKLYYKNNIIKIDIALVKGKKQQDQREKIKWRDSQKEIKRYI